jgi:hypothetical protein
MKEKPETRDERMRTILKMLPRNIFGSTTCPERSAPFVVVLKNDETKMTDQIN